MAHDEEDEPFNSSSESFLQWLKQNGTNISPKIELADLRYRNAGRGVLAKEDIEEDEELFSIPKSSALMAETSSLPAEFQNTLVDPWLLLILAMVFEHRGSESRWKPYFDVLPKDFDTLMYWSEDELDLLQGSAVVDKIGKAKADQTFASQIVPIIRQHADDLNSHDLTDGDILDICHRMGSTIMAYAFDLERTSDASNTEEDGWEEDSEGEEVLPKAMIPLADMLNADADRNNSRLFYEEDKVVMKAIQPIQAGEELFNDYGPLPRADVLRRYGYVTDNYEKYDAVDVSLDLIKTTTLEELKLEAKDMQIRAEYLAEQDVLDDWYDISRSSNDDGQFSDEFKILLNGLTMPTAEFDKLKKKEKVPKPDLSHAALRVLYSILIRRRAMYAPNEKSEQDVILGTIETRSERRRKMALQVIGGEKAVLQEAATTVQDLLGGEDRKRKAKTFEEEVKALQQASKKRK